MILTPSFSHYSFFFLLSSFGDRVMRPDEVEKFRKWRFNSEDAGWEEMHLRVLVKKLKGGNLRLRAVLDFEFLFLFCDDGREAKLGRATPLPPSPSVVQTPGHSAPPLPNNSTTVVLLSNNHSRPLSLHPTLRSIPHVYYTSAPGCCLRQC